MENLSNYEKGRKFERAVGELLRQAGYEVEPGPEIAGRQTDLVAFSTGRGSFPVTVTFLVECKFRGKREKLGMDVVTDMVSRVTAASLQGSILHHGRSIRDPHVRGWIITNTELTAKAGKHAQTHGIAFTSYDELLKLAVAGLEDYMTDLVHDFDVYRRRYVSLVGRVIRDLDNPQGPEQPVDSWVEAWVASEDDNIKPVLLVGDIGAGKTLCVKKVAATLTKWSHEGSLWAIPVLIPLDEVFTDSTRGSCRDLVFEYLEKTGIAASPGTFAGDVASVVIADGLESVSPSQDRPVKVRGHLHGFGGLHGGRTKALVTCRTDIFKAFLAERSTYEHFDVMILSKFTEQMVKSYLTRCVPNPDEAWEIFKGYRLDNLARVPVILELLTRHVEKLPYLGEPTDTRAKVMWEIVRSEISDAVSYLDQGSDDAQSVLEAVGYNAWQRDTLTVILDELGGDSALAGRRSVDIGRDAAWILSGADSADILDYVAQETTILKQMGSNVAFTHPVFRDILAAGYLFNKLTAGDYIDSSTNVGSFVLELLRSSQR